jgi:hypothetical protein
MANTVRAAGWAVVAVGAGAGGADLVLVRVVGQGDAVRALRDRARANPGQTYAVLEHGAEEAYAVAEGGVVYYLDGREERCS